MKKPKDDQFGWWQAQRRPISRDKRDQMVRGELEDRAALLFRLGYPASLCKARLRGNLLWDYELHGRPRQDEEIDRIVDAVYQRGGGSGQI
jgi:hypothetical protein